MKVTITLRDFNILWSEKANHVFTQDEFEALKKYPDFFESYYLMDKLAQKYAEPKKIDFYDFLKQITK